MENLEDTSDQQLLVRGNDQIPSGIIEKTKAKLNLNFSNNRDRNEAKKTLGAKDIKVKEITQLKPSILFTPASEEYNEVASRRTAIQEGQKQVTSGPGQIKSPSKTRAPPSYSSLYHERGGDECATSSTKALESLESSTPVATLARHQEPPDIELGARADPPSHPALLKNEQVGTFSKPADTVANINYAPRITSATHNRQTQSELDYAPFRAMQHALQVTAGPTDKTGNILLDLICEYEKRDLTESKSSENTTQDDDLHIPLLVRSAWYSEFNKKLKENASKLNRQQKAIKKIWDALNKQNQLDVQFEVMLRSADNLGRVYREQGKVYVDENRDIHAAISFYVAAKLYSLQGGADESLHDIGDCAKKLWLVAKAALEKRADLRSQEKQKLRKSLSKTKMQDHNQTIQLAFMVPLMQQIRRCFWSLKNRSQAARHEAECLKNIGLCYSGFNIDKEALKVNEEALVILERELSKDEQKYKILGQCRHNAACALFNMGHFGDAATMLRMAIHDREAANDWSSVIDKVDANESSAKLLRECEEKLARK